jgi:tetratricopeptide (TPR) repeat protein
LSFLPFILVGGNIIRSTHKGLKDAASKAFTSKGPPCGAADNLLREGLIYDKAGNNTSALACFERALRVEPRSVEAWYCKGLELGKLSRFEEAAVSYEECVRIDPNRDEAWNNLALSLMIWKRADGFTRALFASRKAVTLVPSLKHLLLLAMIELEDGKEVAALHTCERALQINPSETFALVTKASALGMTGREKEGLEYLDRAATLRPCKTLEWTVDPSEALIIRGRLLCQMQQFDEGLQLLHKAKAVITNQNDRANPNLQAVIQLESLCRDLPSILCMVGIDCIRLCENSVRIAVTNDATKLAIVAIMRRHPAFTLEFIPDPRAPSKRM